MSELTRTGKARQVTSKVKGALIIVFGVEGIGHKKFVLADQTISSAYAVTFYGNCVKMCEDFASNFGDNITGC
jgi:hypothetical protein